MRELVVYTLLFSAMLQLLMAVYAWERRSEPAAKPLIWVFIIGFVWALAYAIDMDSNELNTKIVALQIADTFVSFGPLAFLLLTLEHLGMRQRLTNRHLALLLVPSLLLIILTWTSPYHQLYRYDFRIEQVGPLEILQHKTGALFMAVMLVLQGLSIVTYYLLIRSLFDASRIKRQQSITILLAMLVLFFVNAITILNLNPIPGFDFTPHALVISGGLFAFAIFRYSWLTIVPIARSALVDILPGSMLAIDVENRVVDVNPHAEKMLNASAKDIIGRDVHIILATLGMDVLPEAESGKIKKEVSVSRTAELTEYYDLEIIPFHDSAGKFQGRVLHFNNITERKQNELRLLQLTQAVEQSPASVVITDLQNNIIYVNPRFLTLTGYSQAELIGKNPRIIQSGQTPASVYADMWATIQSGKPWRGELLNKTKNGDLYWELEVIAPVFDQAGKIINYIAVKEDITERKYAERAVQIANIQLAERLTEIGALQVSLHEQAIRDSLTQLYNRRFLNETIEHEIRHAERISQPLSIILLDIDDFKSVNDTYGHAAGDECLVMLAGLLKQNTRKSDIACRYGGEEFLVVLSEADAATAKIYAEKLRDLFAAASVNFEGRQIKATISLGVATFPIDGNQPNEIIKKADAALYESKHAGRNRVTVWSEWNHP